MALIETGTPHDLSFMVCYEHYIDLLLCKCFLQQQKELLGKDLPEMWKLAISESIEKKLFSKVLHATRI
jgi:hypothetical protein